ncbi:hypothetical protein [Actinomyces sp. ZJ308]|uniref:hypothetical protein n=1 Tax=Actinomyces sp. ZJ308 TaxID=2708342 RepID=UPI0014200DED|nr:hypothetical protein [Actinomyces sp. ZJ308]
MPTVTPAATPAATPTVTPTVVIRSLPARLGTALIAVAAPAMALTIGLADGPARGLRALVWAGALAFLTWLLWWAPQITLSPRALTIRNAWRTHVLGWGEVEMCRTRWGLSVITPDDVEVRASAAPRRGGMAESFRRRQAQRERQDRRDGLRASEPVPAVRPEYLTGEGIHRTNLDTGDAGALITAYAEQVRGRPGEPAGDAMAGTGPGTGPTTVVGVTSSLNRSVAVVAGALAVAIVAVTVLV